MELVLYAKHIKKIQINRRHIKIDSIYKVMRVHVYKIVLIEEDLFLLLKYYTLAISSKKLTTLPTQEEVP